MRALSLDLRQRIAAAIAQSDRDLLTTYQDIADRFAVSVATVERLARKRREGKDLTPGVSTGRKPLVAPEQEGALAQLVASRPDWTLQELAEAWERQHGGERLSLSAMSRTLRRLGFTYKKRAASPASETRSSAERSASA
jgi:transposase